MFKRWMLISALGLLLAPGAMAGGDESPQTPESKKDTASADDALVTIGGLRIAVDPKTGELRALTPAEAKKLQDEMKKRFPPRTLDAPTVRSDGSLSAVVAPNTLRFSVARTDGSGRVEAGCTDSQAEAIEFLKGAQTAKPEEK
jgi:hypothetical protein